VVATTEAPTFFMQVDPRYAVKSALKINGEMLTVGEETINLDRLVIYV